MKNGFHFCELKDIFSWFNYWNKLAFISIPDDAKVIHFNYKSKVDRIFIIEIIEDWKMWENEKFC